MRLILKTILCFLVCGCTIDSTQARRRETVFKSDTSSQEGVRPADDTCEEGDKRTCHAMLGDHDGVLNCFVGVQFCEAGEWSACELSIQ